MSVVLTVDLSDVPVVGVLFKRFSLMESDQLRQVDFADAVKRARELAAEVRTNDPSKRPHDNGEDTPAKRLNMPGNPISALGNNHGPDSVIIDHLEVPDSCVGLIIGRGGESINQIQSESGCRVQMSQTPPFDVNGKPMRGCTLTGPSSSVEKAKQMISSIVTKAGETMSLSRGQPVYGSNGPSVLYSSSGSGAAGSDKTITTEMFIPGTKCGLVIGKGGETIKSLQERAGVKMVMIQESNQPSGLPKPLRIIGEPNKVEYAKQLIEEIMNSKHDMNEYGSLTDASKKIGEVIVPKHAVGSIIGRGGETIRRLTSESGARIQFKIGEDHNAPERTAVISGTMEQIDRATRMITDLVNKSASVLLEASAYDCCNFEGCDSDIFYMHVPANKTGLVIGKGGETIKQINMDSGARVELSRETAPNDWEKVFVIRGTPYQINHATHLIRIKVGDIPPGTPVPPFPTVEQQQQVGYPYPSYNPSANAAAPGAGSQDPAAWAAYYAQYYQQSGGVPYGQAYTGAAATNPNPVNQSSPSINPQTGQPDYTAQWIEYYRTIGRHDQATAILEAQALGNQAQNVQQSSQIPGSTPVQTYPYSQPQSQYGYGQQPTAPAAQPYPYATQLVFALDTLAAPARKASASSLPLAHDCTARHIQVKMLNPSQTAFTSVSRIECFIHS
ncbi:Far upstream element-binding protein 2 [Trichinella sp. T6]|nr:Far upstream element-binding protein 2 [Trichinella sp. T6]